MMDDDKGLATQVLEGLHVVLAVLYVSIFFVAERIFPLVFMPWQILNRLVPCARPLLRMPLFFLVGGTAMLVWGAAGGMRMAAAASPLAQVAAGIGWFVCLGMTGTAYFIATATPPSLAAIEEVVARRWPERWYAKRLKKSIDAYYLRAVIGNSIMMVSAVAALIWPRSVNFYSVFYYIFSLMVIARLHEELDHNDIHNNFFSVRHLNTKSEKWMVWLTGKYLRFFLNPVCSRIPHFYRAHHVYMHHVENNGVDDLQTTVFRDRTSFFDFCKHALLLAVSNSLGMDLYRYFSERHNGRERRSLVLGLTAWFAVLGQIALMNPAAAVVILVIHFAGAVPGAVNTYVWHGLVDLDDTENVYKNSVNSVMNDGRLAIGSLHLRHHLKGGEHWTRQFAMTEEDRKNCERHHAVLFLPFQANVLLKAFWTRRFDVIAQRMVRFDEQAGSADDAIALIRARTRPLISKPRSENYRRLDRATGLFFSRYVLSGKMP
jgi:hypothetical protein